jgi:hypothetical protein
MYLLGHLYEKGLGVEKSLSKAIELYHKACEDKDDISDQAAYRLGYAYYDGLGVERDLKKSKYYFDLAIEHGYQCSYSLEMVKRELGEVVQDNLMHEYAEKIVQKPVPNDRLYVRISKDLEKDFGSAWHAIDKETKNFLTSGLFTFMVYYSTGAHIYGNLDFSQSIIEMCKALERELGKYLYTGYIEYLKTEKINLDYTSGLYSWFTKSVLSLYVIVSAILKKGKKLYSAIEYTSLVYCLWIVNHMARKLEGICSISSSTVTTGSSSIL